MQAKTAAPILFRFRLRSHFGRFARSCATRIVLREKQRLHGLAVLKENLHAWRWAARRQHFFRRAGTAMALVVARRLLKVCLRAWFVAKKVEKRLKKISLKVAHRVNARIIREQFSQYKDTAARLGRLKHARLKRETVESLLVFHVWFKYAMAEKCVKTGFELVSSVSAPRAL